MDSHWPNFMKLHPAVSNVRTRRRSHASRIHPSFGTSACLCVCVCIYVCGGGAMPRVSTPLSGQAPVCVCVCIYTCIYIYASLRLLLLLMCSHTHYIYAFRSIHNHTARLCVLYI